MVNFFISHFENKDQDFILTDEGREIFARALHSRILEVHQYIELDKNAILFFIQLIGKSRV